MFKGNRHVQATATFHTEHAARHLSALGQHFSKKVSTTFGAATAHGAFPFGDCDLSADAARLTLRASAKDADQLALVIDVVTRHLERFAFRENPDLKWDLPPQTKTRPPSKETNT